VIESVFLLASLSFWSHGLLVGSGALIDVRQRPVPDRQGPAALDKSQKQWKDLHFRSKSIFFGTKNELLEVNRIFWRYIRANENTSCCFVCFDTNSWNLASNGPRDA
jgi:hypothetical protein